MKYELLLKKLDKWIRVIQKAIIATVVFEGILVILIGVASNKVTEKFDLWLGILIFCSVLYLILAGIKAIYQIKFPGSIVEELDSKRKLGEKEDSLERQKVINDYINQVISKLNDQTCNIRMYGNENLCDQELQVRLTDLLKPVIKNTNIFLGTQKAQSVTLGVYLSFYRKFPTDSSKLKYYEYNGGTIELEHECNDLITDEGILILEDDLGFSRFISKDLMKRNEVNNEALEIQSSVRRAMNNNRFGTHSFESNNETYSIICSEMPEVCSEETTGVMFIIIRGTCQCPDDLPYVFRIFNRLTANYVYKYNSCIDADVKSTIQRMANEEKEASR